MKLNLRHYLPIAVCLVVMGVTMQIQGVWSERWEKFEELDQFAARIKLVPTEVGDWKMVQDKELDPTIMRMAGAVGSLDRVYRNSKNEDVHVSLVCGRLQDVFYHTPDRCYRAQGFDQLGDKTLQTFAVGPTPSEFFTATFLKSGPAGDQRQRIFWSWTSDGSWQAPSNEKWTFAGERALFKLYVMTPGMGPESASQRDPAVEFIREFTPVLSQVFFGPKAEQNSAAKKEVAQSK